MELSTRQVEPSTFKWGSSADQVIAGQALKIETTPDGVEILNATCPAGKAWNVRVDIYIDELDA